VAVLIFWGKPGCAGNASQIALLRESGHTVDVRDLNAAGWTAERLRPFFGDTDVPRWFNASAPKVKRDEIVPHELSEASALELLIAEPLLIRRPLLECDGVRTAGFDRGFIAAWIGLADHSVAVMEGCPRPDMAPCQRTDHADTGVSS